MTALHLIAHIVRGEPAFDVACKLQIGEEEGWIIPTSGHRAYPYWFYLLDSEDTESILGGWAYHQNEYTGGRFNNYPPKAPEGWPDHYAINEPRKTEKPSPQPIDLEELGL